MQHEHISDGEIDGWLNTLGITSLCQWDVLLFVYRHQTSLVGADFIARLLGYPSAPVVDALDVLEFLELVERSRVSQIVRLYQFTMPSDPQRDEALKSLLALASHRGGRLRLAKSLRGGGPMLQARLQAAQRFLAEAQQALRATRQRLELRRGGNDTWRKAI